MPKFIDLSGQKFGRLTVLYREEPHSYPIKWVCECECGSIKSVKGASLTQGRTQSCGCLKNENLVGQKFNFLTPIELLKDRAKNRQKVYKCLCDCGNCINVSSSDLKTGNTKSCGCYNIDLLCERCIDITGQKFGHLTVLGKGNGNVQGVLYWRCKCECGNIVNVPSRNLREGKTISCGCIHSRGEAKITQLLLDNQINYKPQYTFDNFKYHETNGVPRFDFGILNNKNELQYLIEYDGIQHFDALGGWNDEDSFEIRKCHDNQKNEFCICNNIPLIRIPYWRYDDLNLNDLSLDISMFLVKRGYNK